MAIDTAAKRLSMLNFGYGGFETLLSPTLDSVDSSERLMRVGLYIGTLIAQVTLPFGAPFLDVAAALRTAIGAVFSLEPTISRRARLSEHLERAARFASERLSRSVRDE